MLPTIYTDGSSLGNPGKGGWAFVVVVDNEVIHTKSGGAAKATNNEMELTAAIEACLYSESCDPVTIVTDSNYVRQGITTWINNWKKNGWMTAAWGGKKGKPVKNKALWERLDQAREGAAVMWEWTAAHAGNTYNEMADKLAKEAATAA